MSRRPTLEEIRVATTQVFGISDEDFFSPKRNAHIGTARQAFVLVARDVSGQAYGYSALSAFLKRQCHSTAMSAERYGLMSLRVNERFRGCVAEIYALLDVAPGPSIASAVARKPEAMTG